MELISGTLIYPCKMVSSKPRVSSKPGGSAAIRGLSHKQRIPLEITTFKIPYPPIHDTVWSKEGMD